jgi:molybdenum cofactor biosynthesis enzyme MoaA
MRRVSPAGLAALAARAGGRASAAAPASHHVGWGCGAPSTALSSAPPRGPGAFAIPDHSLGGSSSSGSLLPALVAWQRALHAPSDRRSAAAAAAAAAHPLPMPSEDDDEEEEQASTRHQQQQQQHARRLREMEQQQQQQQPPRRRLDLSQVPMLDVRGAGGCASSSSPSPAAAAAPVRAAPPPLDWRAVVQRARAANAAAAAAPAPAPLTDLFGRHHDYLRISLTERCNLRCSYCMPEEGVALTPQSHLLSPTEVQRLARLFVRAGVKKIRLTGGEPTVRRDLREVVARLSDLRDEGLESIALTSNGVALERQLAGLKEAGLTHLNVSLDTLSAARFERLARRPAEAHARVLSALDAALEVGFGGTLQDRDRFSGGQEEKDEEARGAGAFAAGGGGGGALSSSAPFSSSSPAAAAALAAAAPRGVKLNVVVVRGVNDDEVELFSALTRRAPLNVRFIEYMPFDGNAWGQGKGMVPYAELRGRADAYAARALAEEQLAAIASAALPFPLPVATAAGYGCGGGGSGGGLLAGAASAARGAGGVFGFAAAAYHRLAGGTTRRRDQPRERPPPGHVSRFAADVAAADALPLVPPPSSPCSSSLYAADRPLLALRRLDDHPSEVAKNFRAPGHAGTLSFVTSMTHHFCGGCSRLRLLADGALKVCLFGANEVSLRDAVRGGATDDDLLAVVGAAVRRKKASHAGMHEIARTSNRPMITIGG